MKKFAKITSIVLIIASILALSLSLTACNQNAKDLEYILEKGVLVVGITDYEPYDFETTVGSGEWTGFDAEVAKIVAQELGVDIQFVEIDWEKRNIELQSKSIDVIWNGMTMTDELAQSMDFSYAYAKNAQVVVIKTDNAATYTNQASINGAKIAVESGSVAESLAKGLFASSTITGVSGQNNALFEVLSATSDVAIVDSAIAKAKCGKGDFASLQIVDGLALSEELFAVGIRKGSPLKDQINSILVKLYNNGTLANLKAQFGPESIDLCDLSVAQ